MICAEERYLANAAIALGDEHATAGRLIEIELVGKIGAGERKLPLVHMAASPNAGKGSREQELAVHSDERTEAAQSDAGTSAGVF